MILRVIPKIELKNEIDLNKILLNSYKNGKIELKEIWYSNTINQTPTLKTIKYFDLILSSSDNKNINQFKDEVIEKINDIFNSEVEYKF